GTVLRMTRFGSVCVAVLLASTAAGAATVQSGSLQADVATAPFALTFTSDDGPVLSSATIGDPTGPSALSVQTPAGWIHATAVSSAIRKGNGYRLMVQTTDPGGGTFAVNISPAGEGIIEVEATYGGATDDLLGIGAAWTATQDERFYG